MKLAPRCIIILFGLSLSGCFRNTVTSGRPPDRVAFEERWHHGYLLGAVESSGPYDLQRLCPEGWSLLSTETDPLQTLIMVVTVGIYTPQSVTVVCAAQSIPSIPGSGPSAEHPAPLPPGDPLPPP